MKMIENAESSNMVISDEGIGKGLRNSGGSATASSDAQEQNSTENEQGKVEKQKKFKAGEKTDHEGNAIMELEGEKMSFKLSLNYENEEIMEEEGLEKSSSLLHEFIKSNLIKSIQNTVHEDVELANWDGNNVPQFILNPQVAEDENQFEFVAEIKVVTTDSIEDFKYVVFNLSDIIVEGTTQSEGAGSNDRNVRSKHTKMIPHSDGNLTEYTIELKVSKLEEDIKEQEGQQELMRTIKSFVQLEKFARIWKTGLHQELMTICFNVCSNRN